MCLRTCSFGALAAELFAGHLRISELPDTELLAFAETTRTRLGYASYLMNLIETGNLEPFSTWIGRQAR